MGTTVTRYRILEWSPAAAARSGLDDWSARGLAFERDGNVYLWLPGWRTPLPLPAPLEELSATEYPTAEERWRWRAEIAQAAEEQFWPNRVLLREMKGVADPKASPQRVPVAPCAMPPDPPVNPISLHRVRVPLRGRREDADARSPVGRLSALRGTFELEDRQAANVRVTLEGGQLALPFNVPANRPIFEPLGRVPVLIGICAPVLGERDNDPPTHLHVDGWREWQRVREVVDRFGDSETDRGVPLKLFRLRPPTLEQLREALHTTRGFPAFPVVHLIGHATAKCLAMEQENGRERLVTPEHLASAFVRSGVQLSLLNICYGLNFAEALLDVDVGVVVTTVGQITDPEATLLARELYLRLAFGDTVREAHAWAQESILGAYQRGKLPPLLDYHGQSLESYGRERAANIVLRGDGTIRLPLSGAGDGPLRVEIDLNEPPNNLPHPDDVFVGRGRELVQLSDYMQEHKHRIIAIVGIGGIGKTTLALRVAQRNRWRFHRIIYLTAKDADGVRRPLTLEDACRRIEAVLGLGGSISCLPTAAARSQRAAEILNAHPSLLVVDSIDLLSPQELHDLADFLQLLEPNSGTMALVTARREHVPPLLDRTRGDYYYLELTSFESADSVSLLAEYLRPPTDRTPTAEETEVWDKVPELSFPPGSKTRLFGLAKRADVPIGKVYALEMLAEASCCHPLLLAFAAADLKTPGNEWSAVLHSMKNLRGSELQQQVEHKIGAMCRELGERSPAALQLIQTMLVFSQGAKREALRHVWCGRQVDDDSQEAQIFDDARRAARRAALLQYKSERYDLHPLVVQYLRQGLPAGSPAEQQRFQAHAAFFLDFLRRSHKRYESLEPERLNLFRGMDWAERAGEDRMVVEFARHLFDFLWVRGYWNEGRERMRRGAAAAQRLGDQRCEAHLLFQTGQLCRYQGAYGEAREYYQKCLDLEASCQDPSLRGRALLELGILCRYQGEHATADSYYRQALALEEQHRDPILKANGLHELGVLYGLQGKLAEARRYSMDALAIEQELPDRTLLASTLQQVSVQYWVEGDFAQARAYCEQALELAVELDNQILKARLYSEYGMLKGKQGELPEARELLELGQEMREQLGDRIGQAATLYFLGELSLTEGNCDAGEELFNRSLELADELASRYWRAWNLYGLGLCAEMREQPEVARSRFEEALPLANQLLMPLAARITASLEHLNSWAAVRKEPN